MIAEALLGGGGVSYPYNYFVSYPLQTRSKAKTTGGGGGGEQIATPIPRHLKNRPIREFTCKMEQERQKSSRFSKQNNNFAPTSHFLVHFFAVSLTQTTT